MPLVLEGTALTLVEICLLLTIGVAMQVRSLSYRKVLSYRIEPALSYKSSVACSGSMIINSALRETFLQEKIM